VTGKRLTAMLILILLILAASAIEASAMPPRPDRGDEADGEGDSSPRVASIGLYLPFDGWTVVQWQDESGWYDVESWQASPEQSWVIWNVEEKDFGKGPFRWAVFEGQERGEPMAVSEEFYLPQRPGQELSLEVIPVATPTARATSTHTPAPTETGTPTATPTPLPTPRPTPSASLTPTTTQTPSPVPTSTPSPVPTATPPPRPTPTPTATPIPASWQRLIRKLELRETHLLLGGLLLMGLGAVVRRRRTVEIVGRSARVRRSWFHAWVKDLHHQGEVITDDGFDEVGPDEEL